MAEYREFQDGELIAGTRYQVQRLIGVGGMGTVYEVEHVELGKRFVLKALLRELSRREDLVIRLRNEWRSLGRLEHPNIVTVTDAGTSATGVPFYVMERLEGETLSERMRRKRRFPVREAVDISIGVLEGLAAAHQIGVVHRDVKPPNIFLVGEGRPKVLDFGVAKIADDPGVITARGIAVGTPRYMSPEQARGESVDGRADVYSTGLILFEMVSGVSPFDDARDANELILAHLVKRPPALSSLVMGVPAELDAAVARMLAKGREERPVTARDAARILREVATQLASSAARASRSAPPSPPNYTLVPNEEEHNTTRPDGIASRRSTLTSGSVADGMLHPAAELNPAQASQLNQLNQANPLNQANALNQLDQRTVFGPDTLIAPPSFAGNTSAQPSPPSFPQPFAQPFAHAQPYPQPFAQPAFAQPGEGPGHTEMLTAVPQPEPAVTRTRYPSPSLSETPPPVTPTPEDGPFSRPARQRWSLIVVGVTLIAAVSVIIGALMRPAPGTDAEAAARPTTIAARSPVPGPVPANATATAAPAAARAPAPAGATPGARDVRALKPEKSAASTANAAEASDPSLLAAQKSSHQAKSPSPSARSASAASAGASERAATSASGPALGAPPATAPARPRAAAPGAAPAPGAAVAEPAPAKSAAKKPAPGGLPSSGL